MLWISRAGCPLTLNKQIRAEQKRPKIWESLPTLPFSKLCIISVNPHNHTPCKVCYHHCTIVTVSSQSLEMTLTLSIRRGRGQRFHPLSYCTCCALSAQKSVQLQTLKWNHFSSRSKLRLQILSHPSLDPPILIDNQMTQVFLRQWWYLIEILLTNKMRLPRKMWSYSRSNPCGDVFFPKAPLLSHSRLRLFMHCGCQIIAFTRWLTQQYRLFLCPRLNKTAAQCLYCLGNLPQIAGLIFFIVSEKSPAIDSFG